MPDIARTSRFALASGAAFLVAMLGCQENAESPTAPGESHRPGARHDRGRATVVPPDQHWRRHYRRTRPHLRRHHRQSGLLLGRQHLGRTGRRHDHRPAHASRGSGRAALSQHQSGGALHLRHDHGRPGLLLGEERPRAGWRWDDCHADETGPRGRRAPLASGTGGAITPAASPPSTWPSAGATIAMASSATVPPSSDGPRSRWPAGSAGMT